MLTLTQIRAAAKREASNASFGCDNVGKGVRSHVAQLPEAPTGTVRVTYDSDRKEYVVS